MFCPYCLQNTGTAVCSNCKETLPPLYVQNFGRPSGSPLILSAVGFSGHGKTVYLAGLLHAMEQELTLAWPQFYRQALDMDSVLTVQSNLSMLRRGELPESTRRNFPRPSLHLLANIPRFHSKYLIAYDPPGEAFDSDEGMERYAHFVQRARVVVFLVSLLDLEEPRESTLHRLIETYVLGMSKMKAKTRNQDLIVAFTKADRLYEMAATHPLVLKHLQNGSPQRLQDPKQYIKELKGVSDELQRFVEQDLGARSFTNITRQQFRSVSYCAVSALGSPPEDGHLATAMNPRCVVDPLVWMLERC